MDNSFDHQEANDNNTFNGTNHTHSDNTTVLVFPVSMNDSSNETQDLYDMNESDGIDLNDIEWLRLQLANEKAAREFAETALRMEKELFNTSMSEHNHRESEMLDQLHGL